MDGKSPKTHEKSKIFCEELNSKSFGHLILFLGDPHLKIRTGCPLAKFDPLTISF